MKTKTPTYLFPALLAAAACLHGQRQSANYSVGAETFAPLAGESNSSAYSQFGVAEPITGLSLKDLPDVRNFAGFIGQLEPIDSDNDGLTDDEEVALGTDPNKADTDGDGLTDKEESDLGTDQNKADTDGDGYSDGAEVNAGTLPLVASSNPNRPPALSGTKIFEFEEHQAIGTVVTHLQATDPDGDAVTFSLVAGNGSQHNEHFTLEANGTLRSKTVPDYDALDKLYARVRLSDGKDGSAEEALVVSVTEEPNEPPVFVGTKSFNMQEHLAIGAVVAQLQATDANGDAVTFSLVTGEGSQHNASFTLEANGTLLTKADIDFDAFDKLYARVKLNDGEGGNSEEKLTVFVTEEPNRPPALAGGKSFNLQEHLAIGTLVTNLQATDADGDTVTFSLVTGEGSQHNAYFTLEANGTLRTKAVTDFESLPSMFVRVGLNDGKGGSIAEKLSVLVTNDPSDDPDTLAGLDDDGDGLTNGQEAQAGTNPNNPDTDGDGHGDKAELNAGTNPVNALDYPGKTNPVEEESGSGSPDGRIYEVVKAGHTRSEAQQLAVNLGAVLPVVNTPEMKAYLLKLLDDTGITTTSEELEAKAAWVGHPDDEAVALSPDPDFRSVEFLDEEESLAAILAFPKPVITLPVVRTLKPEVLANGEIKAKGRLLADGGAQPGWHGFLLSQKINAKPGDWGAQVISATVSGELFEANISGLQFETTYYLRALAENSKGLAFGSFKRIRLEPESMAPFDGLAMGDDWQESSWFGSFHWNNSRWVFHSGLDWIYVSGNPPVGWWFWSEDLGWVWTSKDTYPYLWRHDIGSWWYFMGRKGSTRAFYDYGAKEWKEL
jgi:hypothetical protein